MPVVASAPTQSAQNEKPQWHETAVTSYYMPYVPTPSPVVETVQSRKEKWEPIIIENAKRFGVDGQLVSRIAGCESKYDPLAKNSVSSASGLFQWTDGSYEFNAEKYGYPLEKKNDPETQIELSVRVIADKGTVDWNSSKGCWASKTPNKTLGSLYDARSCVSYVKYRRPDLDEPWGTPKKYAATHELSSVSWPGAVGISKESSVWHAFYVESVSSSSMLISETNFKGDFLSTRSLSPDDPIIRGFR